MDKLDKQILVALKNFNEIKNEINLQILKSSIIQYTNLFPELIINDKYSFQRNEHVDEYLYGKIIDEMIGTVDKFDDDDVSLVLLIKKLTITDNLSFSMIYEIFIVADEYLKKSKNAKTINMIASTFAEVIKSDALRTIIVDVCINNCNYSITQSAVDEKWRSFSQLLVSLPSKLANKINPRNLDNCFDLSTFSKIIIYHLSRATFFLNNCNQNGSELLEFSRISSLISKCISSFGSSRCVDLINIFKGWSLKNKNMNVIIQKILYSMDRNSIEPIAVFFFDSIDNPQEVKLIFGNLLESRQWRYVLTTRIPLLSFYTSEKLVVNLITYLSDFNQNSNENILFELIIKLLNVWCNKTSLNNISIDQHKYITQLIITSIIRLKPSLKPVDKVTIEQLLFEGTSTHLTSLQTEIRAIGMITSEIIVEYLNHSNSDDSPKLRFDYDKLPSTGKDIVNEFKNFRNNITKNAQENRENGLDKEICAGNGEELVYKLGTDCGLLKSCDSESLINTCSQPNERNESADCETLQGIGEKKNGTLVFDEKADVDNVDSDDDLVPYDISSDKPISENLKPIYLRDLKEKLLNSLEKSDTADLFAESLKVAEKLILSQLPNDDSSFALELLNLLFTLNEQYPVDDFRLLKTNACVAIATVYPKECAELLCQKFHSESSETAICDRLFCLEILSKTAKNLSKIETNETQIESKEDEKNLKSVKSYRRKEKFSLFINSSDNKKSEFLYDEEFEVPSNEPDDQQWRRIIEERIQSKTRQLTHKTKNYRMSINKFNDVAKFFFYPLLFGMSRRNTYIHKIPSSYADQENILLVTFLNTMSTLIIAAENCVNAPKMALETLQLAWSLKHHEEANIRLAVMNNIGAAIAILSKDNFSIEMFDLLLDFKEWLQDVSASPITGDPNFKCRSSARNILSLIDSFGIMSIQSQ